MDDGQVSRPERTTPHLTVVVPAYNAAHTIARALDSLVRQRDEHWRAVIVDDGSSDSTADIVGSYAALHDRITLVRQDNLGVSAARNAGVAASKSEYIAFLDADDELAPSYVEEMREFIHAHPGFEIYHPNLRVIAPDGTVSRFTEVDEIRQTGFEALLESCAIAVGGAVVTRRLHDGLGGFKSGILCEDYDYWLRATAQGARALHNPRELYVYHQEGRGRRSDDAVAGIGDAITSLEGLLDAGALSATFRESVEGAIDLKREERLQAARETEMAAQAQRVSGTLERLMGARLAALAMPAVRGVGRMLLPLRRAQAARRAGAPVQANGRPLKVLVVPSWYPRADEPTAGIFIRQQVDALSSVCDVAVLHVFTSEDPIDPTLTREGGVWVARAGIRPGRLHILTGYRSRGLAAFTALRDEWGLPDVIHVQALWPAGLLGRTLSRRLGVPYVVTEHSEEYLAQSDRKLVRTPGMVPFVLRPLARGASRTIAVSRFLLNRLDELGLAVDPVVIPNIAPMCEPTRSPREQPMSIAHVSVMGPAKNLPGLLNAVSLLSQRRRDFRLILVGEGECRSQAEELASTLGLGGLVHFTGRLGAEEVRAVLSDSMFVVVSSTHETFSVSAAESLMCGRPVVSTRCGGPEEFITPEVGVLVAVDDVPALADGLDWMLDHCGEYEPSKLHQYAVSRFSPDQVASRILTVYLEAIHA